MSTGGALRLNNPDRFAWRHWDGELVLFDEESGETHLLSGWAGAVLDFIAEKQPIDNERLRLGLSTATGLPDDANLRERVQEAMDTLRSFEMICD